MSARPLYQGSHGSYCSCSSGQKGKCAFSLLDHRSLKVPVQVGLCEETRFPKVANEHGYKFTSALLV